ncbi:hypothetical protein [Streptosporangium lutulentum]|uniref:Uncharacterized protein n=1 Tax=Streptosporangium lutulentum TaxID=1461250 RepID=A0ABT9Q4V4_9ACTN|nr:hypothetical protein [Streptosporangium lutulentum]MDP9841717.1 hypothetical protein [Streptosporangium lutulentum]
MKKHLDSRLARFAAIVVVTTAIVVPAFGTGASASVDSATNLAKPAPAQMLCCNTWP